MASSPLKGQGKPDGNRSASAARRCLTGVSPRSNGSKASEYRIFFRFHESPVLLPSRISQGKILDPNIQGEVINKAYEANDRGFDATLFNGGSQTPSLWFSASGPTRN